MAIMSSTSGNNDREQLKVIGICGGIGSGKSTACKLLVSDLNCVTHIDADKVAHSVYAPGSQAVNDVVAEFGSGILEDKSDNNNNTIDRKKLGKIVFAEKSAMSKLEQIVWPHVKTKLAETIDDLRGEWKEGKAEGNKPIVIVEAAILLDAGWDDLLDGIWVVKATEDVALQRLMETRNMTKEDSEKRINAQNKSRGIGNINEEIDNGVITAVIENNGSLDNLKEALGNAIKNPKSWK
jgi:dephospho-CoA kinase